MKNLDNRVKINYMIYLKNGQKKFSAISFYNLVTKKYSYPNSIEKLENCFYCHDSHSCSGETKKLIHKALAGSIHQYRTTVF